MFLATTIAGSILRRPYRRLIARSGQHASGVLVLALATATALAAVPLLRPTNVLPETDHEWAVSRQLARPLLDDLGARLDELRLPGPVLIDLGAVRHVRYTLLAELQQRDIDFVFPAGSTDLSRFGDERCDDGTAAYLLTLRGGSDAVQLRGPDTLLASVPGLTDEQAARSAELAARFGDALRDGSIAVDVDVVAELGGEVPSVLGQVLDTPDMPARRLGEFLANWSRFGAVEVPAELARRPRRLARSGAPGWRGPHGDLPTADPDGPAGPLPPGATRRGLPRRGAVTVSLAFPAQRLLGLDTKQLTGPPVEWPGGLDLDVDVAILAPLGGEVTDEDHLCQVLRSGEVADRFGHRALTEEVELRVLADPQAQRFGLRLLAEVAHELQAAVGHVQCAGGVAQTGGEQADVVDDGMQRFPAGLLDDEPPDAGRARDHSDRYGVGGLPAIGGARSLARALARGSGTA